MPRWRGSPQSRRQLRLGRGSSAGWVGVVSQTLTPRGKEKMFANLRLCLSRRPLRGKYDFNYAETLRSRIIPKKRMGRNRLDDQHYLVPRIIHEQSAAHAANEAAGRN